MELLELAQNTLPTLVPIFSLIGWVIYRMDKKFEKIDERFEKMDKKFTEQFEKMDKKFTEQFEKMDKKFTEQFEKMDKKFTEQFDKSDKKSTEQYNKVSARFDNIDNEIKEIRKDIARLSERIAVVETENIMNHLYKESTASVSDIPNKRSEAMKRVWERRRKNKGDN
jgi:DNA anti-recombination protein RmuC